MFCSILVFHVRHMLSFSPCFGHLCLVLDCLPVVVAEFFEVVVGLSMF